MRRQFGAADFDNDGEIDFAITIRGDYPELLRNDGGNASNRLTANLLAPNQTVTVWEHAETDLVKLLLDPAGQRQHAAHVRE